MKKRLGWITAAILLIGAMVYVLVPSEKEVMRTLKIPVSQAAVMRLLADTCRWKQWWPAYEQGSATAAAGQLGNLQLRMLRAEVTDVTLQWQHAEGTQLSLMQVIPIGRDSAALLWKTLLDSSNLPHRRLQRYSLGNRLGDAMQSVLTALQVYATNPEHVYGFMPQPGKVQDTVLLTTKGYYDTVPGPLEAYRLIAPLEKIAQLNGVEVNRPPLMHIRPDAGGKYLLMVAVPVQKVIAVSGNVQLKRMILGNLLTATVKGGHYGVLQKFPLFEAYKEEHGFTSPAIPYMELVTDRRQVADSSQWVTRFCYPVY
ncbi:MAG: GyrI-like domain-containing protein [Chitinophagaceae bacterium]|jgi:hypothetical protein|nr:GyrI-like domain-containing protein [Chitinophagaceae bacterium]